ncbi:MAG: radical SAM protein [Elusimicrobia bacterium]|nr:radical SAM protein [Elusimicrobiota bacterium]
MPRPTLQRLEVFLTSRCNLACGYCSSKTLVSRPRPVSLSFPNLVRAVKAFLACADRRRKLVVSFTGGEPFLEFSTLSRAVDYLRRRREGIDILVSTNGTLLTRDRLQRLKDNGVEAILSLDGGQAVNDAGRRFRHRPGASVFEAVARNLRRLPRPLVEYMRTVVTVTPGAMPRIAASVGDLRRLGLGRIELRFDAYEQWTPQRLDEARRALAGFREYRAGELGAELERKGGCDALDAYFMSNLGSDSAASLNRICLAPDGRFFPCETLCGLGQDSRAAVGDARRGINLARLARVQAEVRRGMPGQPAALDRYFYARIQGLNPLVMRQGVEELEALLGREFGALTRVQNHIPILRRAGLFAPRRRGAPASARHWLAVAVPAAGPDRLSRCGRALARCLEAPGDDKELLLRISDPAAARDVAENAGLYAVLKARQFGKNVRVAIEARTAGCLPDPWFFPVDHGIFLGLPAPRSCSPLSDPDRTYQLVAFGRRDAARLGRRLEAARRRGFSWAKLELLGDGRPWSGAELKALRQGLRAAAEVIVKSILLGRPLGLLNLAWRAESQKRGPADPRAAGELRDAMARLRRRLESWRGRHPAFHRYNESLRRMAAARSGLLAGPEPRPTLHRQMKSLSAKELTPIR